MAILAVRRRRGGDRAGTPFLPALAAAVLAACSAPPPGPVLPADAASLDPEVAALVERQAAAVREEPASAAGHGTLGLIYEANDLWQLARESYARALALDPGDRRWR
ncbi:MAG: hypothetical protein D6696_05140, partial [Acidobacteria bacterium]